MTLRLNPLRRPLRSLAAVAGMGCLALALTQARAAAPVPRVVEVPFKPAFVRAPGGKEIAARAGQILAPDSLLRTEKPGRLQVQLADGRQFRLGGHSVLRLGVGGLNLEKGQIIAWVNPGLKGGSPLKIRTRVATASIVGTTVFIEATDDSLKVFSWEGHVQVETDAGRRYNLTSGQQLTLDKQTWQPQAYGSLEALAASPLSPRRLSQNEAATLRQKSILLNGFATPMETLPVIEKELGLSAQPAPIAQPAPAKP